MEAIKWRVSCEFYKVLGNRCTSWPGCIVPTSNHTTHSTLGGQIDKTTTHWKDYALSIVPSSPSEA
jgi:hypothetical protein